MALSADVRYAEVHIVDFELGQVHSFQVTKESEPGYETRVATPISSPTHFIEATYQISRMIKEQRAKGAKWDRNFNTMSKEVYIPASVATTSSQVKDLIINQAVANYLRFELISSFWEKMQLSWGIIISKITYKITAKFTDGSTADYHIGTLVGSADPFKLQRDSIKDNTGKLINSQNSSSDWVDHGASWERRNIGIRMTKKCVNTSISTSDGSIFRNRVCWSVLL